jgi:error-prone DNA polymerase
VGVSLRNHPLALLRTHLGDSCKTAAALAVLPDGTRIYTAGLVITRQRPGSAANVTFVTLEDETGFINLVIWERLADRQR